MPISTEGSGTPTTRPETSVCYMCVFVSAVVFACVVCVCVCVSVVFVFVCCLRDVIVSSLYVRYSFTTYCRIEQT